MNYKEEKDQKTRKILIERSSKGVPCVWESLSSHDDSGIVKSTVILDSNGMFKNSITVKQRYGKSSLVPIRVGDLIVKIYKQNNKYSITLFKINTIFQRSNTIKVELLVRIDDISPLYSVAYDDLHSAFVKILPSMVVENICSNFEEVYVKVNGIKENILILNTLMPSIAEKHKPKQVDNDDIVYFTQGLIAD